MSTINNAGNDQDVYWSLYHGFPTLTVAELEAAVKDEKANSNRSTRIKLIERAIKLKQKGATQFRKEAKS